MITSRLIHRVVKATTTNIRLVSRFQIGAGVVTFGFIVAGGIWCIASVQIFIVLFTFIVNTACLQSISVVINSG